MTTAQIARDFTWGEMEPAEALGAEPFGLEPLVPGPLVPGPAVPEPFVPEPFVPEPTGARAFDAGPPADAFRRV
jgi:hypothetical protein